MLKKTAKRNFTNEKKEARKTGGGLPQKIPEKEETKEVLNKVLNLYKDSTSFVGVTGGLEAGVPVQLGKNNGENPDMKFKFKFNFCEKKTQIVPVIE